MKIAELYDEMRTYFGKIGEGRTCDTFKAGNPENEVTGVGVSMFATPDVIRECKDSGINFLIVHEPTYHNHWDDEIPDDAAKMKKQLIDESGIIIARYHDHAHVLNNDAICEGELKYLGLKGKKAECGIWAVNRFVLDEEMTAKELAKAAEERLGIKHIKIAGCTDKKGKKLGCCFGTPGHIAEELKENDFVLTGEICEWELGEMARDYAQLGFNKAILVMGHIGSERAGMMYLAEVISEKHPELNVKYIECGEVYSYTD